MKSEISDEVRVEAERRAPDFQTAWDRVAPSYFAALKKLARKPFHQLEFHGTLTACPIGGAMSHPLLLTIRAYLVAEQRRSTGPLTLDRFTQVLLHELLHWYADDYATPITSATLRKYDDETAQVKAHIHVHALMQGIFTELRKPDVTDSIKKVDQSSEPYRRAWEIVEAEGYGKLIAEIRDTPTTKSTR
jgi:hypothetical protein